MSSPPLIVVAADLNNNLIDGSVVWLRNVLRALSRAGRRGRCIALLRDIRQPSSLLFPPDCTFPDTEVLDPVDLSRMDVKSHETIRHDRLSFILTMIEARYGRVDSILVRGNAYATALLASQVFRNRTCVYTTERPLFASTRGLQHQRDIVLHAKHLFVQSEALRRYFEVYLQAPPGKVTALPPMVENSEASRTKVDKRPVVSYAGKLDSLYCVEELVDLAAALSTMGLEVQIIGNKFNKAAHDPRFQGRLRHKLESGVVKWVEGASHEDSQRYMRSARFGYCVRSVELDNTVELSTKLLEYCAQGTPPIVRRTRQHVELFGADYPYFVDSPAELERLLAMRGEVDSTYSETVERLAALARRYDIDGAAVRLRPLFQPAAPSRDVAANGTAPRMLVATHDPKFVAAALDRLVERGTASIATDAWASTTVRADPSAVKRLPRADVIWCEWCCEQAVWWSQNKQPGQTLVVRLHRFEAFTPFPKKVDWSAVDHLIVVSDFFRRLAIDEFAVPERIIRVLPQYVDTLEFDRPKLPNADFTVGLVGINAFSHKRPDRALEFIEALAKAEPRFQMRIRSRMPWEFPWIWDGRPAERAEFIRLFWRSMQPRLRKRVAFDPPGPDMPEWFRGVSAILSSSDTEGCHTSVAEGMASGCQPICWAWPGATSVYPARFVHDSVDAMVAATIAAVENMHSPAGRQAMKDEAARFDIRHTVSVIEELIA